MINISFLLQKIDSYLLETPLNHFSAQYQPAHCMSIHWTFQYFHTSPELDAQQKTPKLKKKKNKTMMISFYTCIATCQLRTVAFVTKYNASVDMLSVSGELFIIVLTRA